MEGEELLSGVKEFVLKREKPDGGFGATPLLPPTIEDTYFALKTLYELGEEVSLEKHEKFLLSQDILKLTFEPAQKLLELLSIFKSIEKLLQLKSQDLKVLIKRAKNKVKAKKVKLSDLSWTFYILNALGETKSAEKAKNKCLKLIEKTNFLTLKECFYAYNVLKSEFPEKWISFILEAQNPDGGFGFFKGTTSYMENAFFACYVLKGFNVTPKNPSKLLEFIKSCKNKDNGFGRNPQGISFLFTTYYATWILKNLFSK
ncbi:MAG: hypothetical protein GXO57_02500 [Thermodesulfobacteria bacterium]|nr:hypothetical protein [Thermodesulfobacteriota bacterium]